jgi:hypothetical protein
MEIVEGNFRVQQWPVADAAVGLDAAVDHQSHASYRLRRF